MLKIILFRDECQRTCCSTNFLRRSCMNVDGVVDQGSDEVQAQGEARAAIGLFEHQKILNRRMTWSMGRRKYASTWFSQR